MHEQGEKEEIIWVDNPEKSAKILQSISPDCNVKEDVTQGMRLYEMSLLAHYPLKGYEILSSSHCS